MPDQYMFKCDLIGNYQGQAVINTLWYNDWNATIPDDVTALALRGEVGAELNTKIGTAIAVLPSLYSIGFINVRATNSFGQYLDVGPLEVVSNIGGQESQHAGGAGPYATVKLSIDTTRFLGQIPKRGYLAFGPVSEIDVGPGGIVAFDVAEHNAIIAAFSTTYDFSPSELSGDDLFMFPARVSKLGALLNKAFTGFALVNGATIRPQVSFRRSRVTRTTGLL